MKCPKKMTRDGMKVHKNGVYITVETTKAKDRALARMLKAGKIMCYPSLTDNSSTL